MYAISADKVFSEEICRIVFSSYLVQLDRLVSDSLLNPKALGIDVSQFTQSLASADPKGRRAVGPNPHWEFKPQVTKQCLVPQAYSSCFDDAIELGFTRAQ